ncbi:MBL fold metallo-hydrolase [Pseudostreptobacillus hongkongensis]|uniref:MBL fold metallo-hydrolase n=1 Tax=Pseudostreptobacillus hongkongensis TaxID=1162717 RepID=UPI0028D32D35|nr:MBL fold metallo-hydrolase [Pseudostreptobacillus hongkongensis]
MKVAILGSSSSGNSTFVEVGSNKILIDVGFSLKKIEEKLLEIGECLKNISAVFITHEHGDHVKSLGPILRKYDITVYIHRDSFEVLKNKIGNFDKEKICILDNRKVFLNNACVTNFDLEHDASHCLGYCFEENNKKFVYITDTGYVSKILLYNCMDADVIALESNYDLDLLMNGSYPWDIKNRIKSKYGHLSNQDALNILKKVYSNKLKKLFLMHLSEENNIEALAINNIKSEFNNLNIEVSGEKITSIFEI